MNRKRAVVILLAFLPLPACGQDAAPQVEVPSWAKVAPEQIAEAQKHGVPVAFENDLGMRFVLIPAGTFLMGSPEGEEGRGDYETQHEVTISTPFYMSICEVTNGQYRQFDPTHASLLFGPNAHRLNDPSQPVSGVSRDDAGRYAEWVGGRPDSPPRVYRLPTEPEWECACRAGTVTRFFFGEDESLISRYANTAEVAAATLLEGEQSGADGHVYAAPVGSYLPNPWGLHDMIGNVREFCTGTFFNMEPRKPSEDPVVEALVDPRPDLPDYAPTRGGSWIELAVHPPATPAPPACTARSPEMPHVASLTGIDVGFRLVADLPEPGERGR